MFIFINDYKLQHSNAILTVRPFHNSGSCNEFIDITSTVDYEKLHTNIWKWIKPLSMCPHAHSNEGKLGMWTFAKDHSKILVVITPYLLDFPRVANMELIVIVWEKKRSNFFLLHTYCDSHSAMNLNTIITATSMQKVEFFLHFMSFSIY